MDAMLHCSKTTYKSSSCLPAKVDHFSAFHGQQAFCIFFLQIQNLDAIMAQHRLKNIFQITHIDTKKVNQKSGPPDDRNRSFAVSKFLVCANWESLSGVTLV